MMLDRIFFGLAIWILVLTLAAEAVAMAKDGKAFSLDWWGSVVLAGSVVGAYLGKWRHWPK